MNKYQLKVFFETLASVVKREEFSRKAQFTIASNIKKLEAFYHGIVNAIKPPKELKAKMDEHDSKRISLLIEYSSKNEDGTPVIEFEDMEVKGKTEKVGKYILDPVREEECHTKMTALDAEYSEHIEKAKAFNKEVHELMNSEEEVQLSKCSYNDLPDNLAPLLVLNLLPMIVED